MYRTATSHSICTCHGYHICHNFQALLAFYVLQDMLRLVVLAGEGVEHLQRLKIIHGDLSSRNILLDHSTVPRLKIADFGNAIQLGPDQTIRGT